MFQVSCRLAELAEGGWEPTLLKTAVGTPGHAALLGGQAAEQEGFHAPPPPTALPQFSCSLTTTLMKEFDEEKLKARAWLPLEPLLGCKEVLPFKFHLHGA